MNNNLLSVSSSPHITSKHSTKNIMLEVIVALMPALIAAIFLFGFYPLVVAIISICSAMIAEYLFCVMTKREVTIGDGSAAVTGLILALNLPPTIPMYVPVIGAFFAVMVVKMLFGGLGKNFANPAATARIFLMLAWTGIMTQYVAPIDLSGGCAELFKYFDSSTVDAMTGATPLAALKANEITAVSVLDMFLGKTGGTAGEVSAIALLIGGVYLMIRKIIDWKIPLVMLGTIALFTLIFKGDISYVLPALFGGGAMLGAFFMATDYATNPNTVIGTLIFAFGIGFITVLVREFGGMNEGVSFGILCMNIVTPLLDKFIKPHYFGFVRKKRVKKVKAKKEEGSI